MITTVTRRDHTVERTERSLVHSDRATAPNRAARRRVRLLLARAPSGAAAG